MTRITIKAQPLTFSNKDIITQLFLSCMYACFLPHSLRIDHQNQVYVSPWLLTSVSSWKPQPSAPASESQGLIGIRVPRKKEFKNEHTTA